MEIASGLVVTGLLAGVSLFVIGAMISLFTGRKAYRGGIRMLLIGVGASVVTYVSGVYLGAGILY